MILQFSPTVDTAVTVLARLVGLSVFAGFLSAGVALLYRWYVRERVPSGLALLAGLAGVAVVLNTTPLLAAEIGGGEEIVEIVDALFNIVAFAGSAAAAFAGIRFGDHLGTDLSAAGGANGVDADVSEIVQTVGRVTSVQLPDEIADVVGYDPVPEETKETLAGRRFLFPRRLTKGELRDRLVSRLKTDYGVGHVDVELGDDGSVEFLAVGSRAAGIGPTLPPATNAVAIRADPAHAASAGDLVQVWETDPMKRVLTGELRGVAGDVVTVAIDAADTPKLNPSERYKLVTLPVQDRPDREFASLLRAADETLATVTIEAGSDLDGVALDSLDVTVAAVTREGESPEPLPDRSRTLHPGDVVYVIATPEILRKVENAAEGAGGPVTGGDVRPGPAGPEPAGPEVAATENATSQTDQDEGSGGAGEPVPDQAPAAEPDSDDGTGDADPMAGDAFVDVDDLPGMDPEIEAPTFSGDRTAEPTEDSHDEENGENDLQVDDESDDAAPNAGAGSSDAPGSIDDALDSMEPLDLDGPADADAASSESDHDEPAGDAAADDLFEESTADASFDDKFEEPAEDPLFEEAGDETGSDDPLDDVATDASGDAAGESGGTADESGDDADDESIPFTPLDVGDEDDPLADPLTGGGDDGDGSDEPEREGGN